MLTLNFQTAETLHPWAKQILLAWVLLPEEKLEGGLEMQYRSGEGLVPGEITVSGCHFS